MLRLYSWASAGILRLRSIRRGISRLAAAPSSRSLRTRSAWFDAVPPTSGRLASEATSLLQGTSQLESWTQFYIYDGAGRLTQVNYPSCTNLCPAPGSTPGTPGTAPGPGAPTQLACQPRSHPLGRAVAAPLAVPVAGALRGGASRSHRRLERPPVGRLDGPFLPQHSVNRSTAACEAKTFSQFFSSQGAFAGKTVAEVADALRSGAMSTADVPVQYIVRDGNVLMLNTRSAQALEEAGIPREQWMP